MCTLHNRRIYFCLFCILIFCIFWRFSMVCLMYFIFVKVYSISSIIYLWDLFISSILHLFLSLSFYLSLSFVFNPSFHSLCFILHPSSFPKRNHKHSTRKNKPVVATSRRKAATKEIEIERERKQ